jgi:hypothetical protein
MLQALAFAAAPRAAAPARAPSPRPRPSPSAPPSRQRCPRGATLGGLAAPAAAAAESAGAGELRTPAGPSRLARCPPPIYDAHQVMVDVDLSSPGRRRDQSRRPRAAAAGQQQPCAGEPPKAAYYRSVLGRLQGSAAGGSSSKVGPSGLEPAGGNCGPGGRLAGRFGAWPKRWSVEVRSLPL